MKKTKKQEIPHCLNNFKSTFKIVETGKINTPYTNT